MNYSNFIYWNYITPYTGEGYSPKIMASDVVNYFGNIDAAITGSYIDLYSYDREGIIQSSIAPVQTEAGKNYFTWTVGDLPKGKYCFKQSGATVYSNPFCYIKNDADTIVLKYRNTKDIFGFEYESLTSWYNTIRIDANILNAEPGTKSAGFTDYPDQYHRGHAFITKFKQFNTFDFDHWAHQAMFTAMLHDEFYFDDVQYFKPPEADYSISWPDNEHLQANGTVNLEVYNEYKSIIT